MNNKSLFIIGYLILIVFACNKQSKQNDNLREKLITSFESRINSNELGTFRLDTLTDFEWDYGIILLPYTDVDNLSSQINIDLREIKKTGIKHADNKSILVFVQNNEVVHYVEYPRHPGDFANLNSDGDYKMFNPLLFEK